VSAPAAAPAAGRRERTKAANRASILEAARGAFSELGYGATTVRDVVRRTDLASGTFYNYFPDKEAVLRALVDDSFAEMRARLAEARRGARSLEEFVGDAYRAYFEFIVADPPTFELMRRNAGTIRTLFDEPVLGAARDDLHGDLDDAIARGEMPPFDTEYMTAAMAGVALEVGIRMIERDPPDVEGAAAFATAVFLGGIERLGRETRAR
jgi:AcrR family transcriptional regulator